MANPNPTKNGRKFQKGQSGNPKGNSKKGREIARIKRLTHDQVAEIGSLILEGNHAQLKEVALSPDSTVLQLWMAQLVNTSIRKSDAAIFRAVLDRIIGRPRESIELTGKDGGAMQMDVQNARLTLEEREARAQKLAEARAKVGDD
jgi:hypothetical protein